MICFWLRLESANELTLLVTVAQAPRGRRYDSATRSRSLGLQQCYGLLAHVLAMAQGRRRTICRALSFTRSPPRPLAILAAEGALLVDDGTVRECARSRFCDCHWKVTSSLLGSRPLGPDPGRDPGLDLDHFSDSLA